MIFRPADQLDDKAREDVHKRLQFCEDGVDISRLMGVLDLVAEFSVSTDSKSAVDPKIQAIALPISANKKGPFLPGAPAAFATRKALLFEAESNLQAVAGDRRFSTQVIEEMRGFFEKRLGVVESFMCFPIASPYQGREEPPIAILNLHRNKPNPLAGEKLPLLDALLAPLCMALGAVLDQNASPRATLTASSEEHHG